MKTITQKIKEARLQAGLTQKDLASLYGIPRRTVEDWDRGIHEPPEYVANLLIDRIKADFSYQAEKVLSASEESKTLMYTNSIGKPYPAETEANIRQAHSDGKVQYIDTSDYDGNQAHDPKGKLYLVLEPEEYGLDFGITFFVKEE